MTAQVGGDDTVLNRLVMMNLKCAEFGITVPEDRGGRITFESINLGFTLSCTLLCSVSNGSDAIKASSDIRDDSEVWSLVAFNSHIIILPSLINKATFLSLIGQHMKPNSRLDLLSRSGSDWHLFS